jgi:hypothetical protein
MSYLKITEKTTTNTVKSSASVLITQPETNDVETLRRAPLSALADALIAEGSITSAVVAAVLEAMTDGDGVSY